MIFAVRLVLLSLLLTVSATAGQNPWTQLKVGLSVQRTATLLGEPVLRNHGHGFETWTYDHGAEVIIYAGATLVGWTVPAELVRLVRSQDIWSNHPAGEYYATMHAILPRPVRPEANRRTGGNKAEETPRATAGLTYEELLRG